MPSKIPSHAPNKAEERKQLKAASEKTETPQGMRGAREKKKKKTQQPQFNNLRTTSS